MVVLSPVRAALKHSVAVLTRLKHPVGATSFVKESGMSVSDARIGREARYEALIEDAFDKAEAHARAGNLERALESLSEAEDLSGGLPDAYIERRKHWINSLDPLAVVVRR